MKKRIISFILAAIIFACAIAPAAARTVESAEKPYTVTKISNPDKGEREADGLVFGGDRENSYTWRMACRGDNIYIVTTRNIASALVNMYGEAFASAGISLSSLWALINAVTNGDILRNDTNGGANIISYDRTTGEFKVIYTADEGDYFRMAVAFGDNVYFGSYSAVPTNPQYILRLDTEGNFTKVFQTTGSVSLRANCVYDDHLFFAGADERETVPEGQKEPAAKMAVLRMSNEDDTVWERVADYKDFGAVAYDSITRNWASAPVWELASHNGYIYATAPSTAGFVIFRGRPAADGESANEYGWIWEEVAGLNNGINNPGLSEISGGEPGTMRSLIGSVYEFNGELYAYNFDHCFGGEASAFAGVLQQAAGKDVKASDYLYYIYDSLHNPQKIWKLNDETGRFEELTAFTELMEGTANEYVWRLGEYDGDLYVATMDASVIYNYLTQLTNGSFTTMSVEEFAQKLRYIKALIGNADSSKDISPVGASLSVPASSDESDLVAALQDAVDKLESFVYMDVDKENMKLLLDNYRKAMKQLDSTVFDATKAILQMDLSEFLDYILTEDISEAIVGEALTFDGILFKDVNIGKLIPKELNNDVTIRLLSTLNIAAMLGVSYNTMSEEDKAETRLNIENNLKSFLISALESLKAKIAELYNSVDWEGIDMYLYINDVVANSEWGFDLLRTSDGGESFEVITRDGFGDKYNYGCSAFLATDEGLYIGTCNPFYGAQLYLLHDGSYVPPRPQEPTEEPVQPTEEPADPPKDEALLGDADGNGGINIFDAAYIQKGLTGTAGYPSYTSMDNTDSAYRAADADGNGSVNIFDASLIQKYVTGSASAQGRGIGEPIA